MGGPTIRLVRSPSGTAAPISAEGVPEAGHDAVRRVGEGAVEVEDHQLGAMRLSGRDRACHIAIVLDAATASGYRACCGAVTVSDVGEFAFERVDSARGGALSRRSGRRTRHARFRRQRPVMREPPAWLVERLAARLTDLAGYPSRDDELAAIHAVAARHGRGPDEVAATGRSRRGIRIAGPLATDGWRRSSRRRSPNPTWL